VGATPRILGDADHLGVGQDLPGTRTPMSAAVAAAAPRNSAKVARGTAPSQLVAHRE
jgi:hypothetical protein